MIWHISLLEPPTQTCTHSHTRCSIHTGSLLIPWELRFACSPTGRYKLVCLNLPTTGKLKPVAFVYFHWLFPCKNSLRRKLALWPVQAREWAGQHAAYAHCGDVWTPPHRSHPSHAEEDSGSGEWCRGSPTGCGFLGLGFLSSEVAHTASPATGGSAQLIH